MDILSIIILTHLVGDRHVGRLDPLPPVTDGNAAGWRPLSDDGVGMAGVALKGTINKGYHIKKNHKNKCLQSVQDMAWNHELLV